MPQKMSFHHKWIHGTSVAIFLIILQTTFFYQEIIRAALNSNINFELGVVSIFLTSFIASSILYVLIYYVIKSSYLYAWKIKYKTHWIEGTWLHIHDKRRNDHEPPAELRVGYVKLKQFCEYIQYSEACNIYPTEEMLRLNVIDERETRWHYASARIIIKTNTDMIAMYDANNVADRIPKIGIHIFDFERGQGTNYPTSMRGIFSDSMTIDSQNAPDTGRMYLFKLNENLEKAIMRDKMINVGAIKDIASNEKLQNEAYVKKLNNLIREYNKQL